MRWVELEHISRRLGRPVVVCIAEVPAGVFGEQIPDVIADLRTACYIETAEGDRTSVQAQWIRWSERLVSQAIVEPHLTPDQVAHMGPDRTVLLQMLLAEWGIGEQLPSRKLYRKEFLKMVRRMAKFTRRLPSEILRMPISEFWLNWTILFAEADAEEDATESSFEGAFPGRFGPGGY